MWLLDVECDPIKLDSDDNGEQSIVWTNIAQNEKPLVKKTMRVVYAKHLKYIHNEHGSWSMMSWHGG